MVDLYAGCIGLVMDEKCFVPGFGAGSKIFPQSEIERQRVIISTMNLIPMFALPGALGRGGGLSFKLASEILLPLFRGGEKVFDIPGTLPVTTTSTSQSAYNEKRRILVQFGEPFHYNMPFTPFDRIMDLQPTRSFDPLAVEGKDQSATDQDEEEKLQVVRSSAESDARSVFAGRRRISDKGDRLCRRWKKTISAPCSFKARFAVSRSFRPPSTSNRWQRQESREVSVPAALNKAKTGPWRKYRGRKMRGQLRREQYVAATIIQNAARRRLRKLRAIKNESAAKIQKNWRRLKFIHIAIMRTLPFSLVYHDG
ncbi:MAG: hypothetical protein BJ554DRAFT_5439 [Olpidium bornovanus]|uniref:Uncharacterized protein n=1 Tax=Olpidium bornovanus TaxID=278681 RepID=A0A8H7ZZK9_9FUNG|nr:MAG: hypothetical protein BJ554DRAFT_5439 [Olpidium bornovanus]